MKGVAAGIRNRAASERSRDGGCRARASSHVRPPRTLWNSHRGLRAQMLTEFYTPSLCTPERAPADAARRRVATPEPPERASSSMLPDSTTDTGSINCHMSRSSPHAPRRCCPLRQQPSPAPTSCARHPARHALVDAALSSVQAGGNNRVAFLSFDAPSPAAAAPHRRARSEASPSLRVRSGEPTEGRARTSRACILMHMIGKPRRAEQRESR